MSGGVMVELDGIAWCVAHNDITGGAYWKDICGSADAPNPCDLRPVYAERFALGEIVALDHKPNGVKGHGYTMLRYRIKSVTPEGVRLWGPLVFDGDVWHDHPERCVRDYIVPAHTIIEGSDS